MFTFLIIIHGIICVGLIMVVLMQSAKGDGLASAFGGGAFSGAVFGGRGAASFLSRATTVLAVLFMISCIGLTLVSRGRASATAADSAVQRVINQEQQQAPATTPPAATPTQQPTTTPPAGGGK